MTNAWLDGPLLAFDLETTGVDRFTDVPVSYAFVEAENGKVTKTETGIVNPGRPIPPGAFAVHGITQERAEEEGAPMKTAVKLISARLLKASVDHTPVVGMNLDFDLTMLNALTAKHLEKSLIEEGFASPVLDILVIDRHVDKFRKGKRKLENLCTHYSVSLDNAHDAVCDAESTIYLLYKIAQKYEEISSMVPEVLHENQIKWHKTWAIDYSSWRVSQGLEPLLDVDQEWPIAQKR